MVAGTVFREPGFALPGADVTLAPAADHPSGAKVKKQKASTNGRGEFAFRVPAAEAKYILTAGAKGWKAQEKPVSITGEERVDVTFMLDQESKE